MFPNYHIYMDIPDPDVIFHDGYYYLITTTMHFCPGGEILRSADLKRWEHYSYVFDKLESTPARRLEGDAYIYGKGMWAPSLKLHNDLFYVVFASNDTHKTYLYRAKDLRGPWEMSEIEGFYHDSSLLFDNDGRVYIVYGNTDIHLTELNPDLTGPLNGGLDRIIVSDRDKPMLGFEGSHIYKIDGKYCLFMIHSRKDRWRRVEAMYTAESLEGEFTGGDIYDEDLGIRNDGIAQGGVVTGSQGWHMIMFQDSGAVGRLPVIVPFEWKDGKPEFENYDTVEECELVGLCGSDDFENGYKDFWQFNHEPDLDLIRFDRGYHVTTDKVCRNIFHAKNTLTQKIQGPVSEATVTVDGTALRNGDFAGLSAFQGDYAFVGITRENDRYYAVMFSNTGEGSVWELSDGEGLTEYKEELDGPVADIKISCDFTKDIATCFVRSQDGYRQAGSAHGLKFRLDHFTGCRYGLSCFSTENSGGTAVFREFRLL